jgi:hypothetical protein
MARPNGRHRISRSTKIATAGVGLAMAIGAIVVINTAGSPTSARADAADPSFFVDITKVKANVKKPKEQGDASTGTFTVDCGENQNGHFNPDNFIAQPGVKNGAQHLHDYVGNLSTNADSNNKSLLAAGTTCKNGDQSAYFWPVIRIDREDGNGEKQADKAKQEAQQNQGKSNKDKQNRKNDTGDGADNAQNKNDQNKDDNAAADQNTEGDQANADQQGQQKDQQAGKNQNVQQQNKKNTQQDQDKANQNQDGQQQGKNDNRGGKAAQDNNKNDNAAQNQQDGDKNDNQDGKAVQDKAGQNKGDQAQELPGVNDKNEVAGNDGEIVEPANAELTFRGSPAGDVVAMPKFLRVLYGDAKVNTNGPKNARDSWTCAGFEDKVLTNKYPICPNGAAVKRIHAFPSCWDGKNTDSTNHRDHIVFADDNGNCKNGFKAVPQLVVTLTYNIPQDVQEKGQYKVDSFPEEEHDPFSDHDDFANVMSNQIMSRVVDCINEGKTCKE